MHDSGLVIKKNDCLLEKCPEVELHWVNEPTKTFAVLKHCGLKRYYRLSRVGAIIWECIDDHGTVEDLTQKIAKHGAPDAKEKVGRIVQSLVRRGFLIHGEPESEAPSQSRASLCQQIYTWCYKSLSWRVEFANIDALIESLYRRCGYLLFSRLGQLVFWSIACSGSALFVLNPRHITRDIHSLKPTWALVLLITAMYRGFVILHELGHALTVKHFGRQIVGAGFGWFWSGPVLFVNTSDMWLGSRYERVVVDLAGVCAELGVAGLISLLSGIVPFHLSVLFYATSMLIYIRVLYNLCPLFEYDGYYVLSGILDKPNLRRHAMGHIGHFIKTGHRKDNDSRSLILGLLYVVSAVVYFGFIESKISIIAHDACLDLFIAHRWNANLATMASTGLACLIIAYAALALLGDMKSQMSMANE